MWPSHNLAQKIDIATITAQLFSVVVFATMAILTPLVLLAMVPFLLGTDPDASRVHSDADGSNYTMLLEGLLMILAVVYPMCWILQCATRGSSPKITKAVLDEAVGDSDMTSTYPCTSTELPPSVIFVAPHGAKWHADRCCASLKKSSKIQEYTPCQFCSKKRG